MLSKLKLKNFQKHRDLEIDFGAGLQVIRALNEGGKSTLIRAARYALFGAKVLPAPLEEIVTHGEQLNTLKVELDIVVDGTVYNVVRGKSGAEVNYDGGRVTGQTECTNFLSKVLGMDPTAASNLVLSGQGEIRGALEAGTKATAELIERLAEFDQLDRILDLIQSELTTGSTATAEAALDAAKDRLAQAQQVQARDWAALEQAVSSAAETLTTAEASLESRREESRKASIALSTANQSNSAYDRLISQVAQSKALLEKVEQDRASVTLQPLPGDLESVQADLAKAKNFAGQKPAYDTFVKVTAGAVGEVFGGDERLLDLEIRRSREAVTAATAEIAEIARNQALRLGLKITEACTLCGKDVSEVPEVVAKNEKIDREIAELEAKRIDVAQRKAEMSEYLDALLEIQERGRPVAALAHLPAGLVELDTSQFPPAARWLGPTDFSEALQQVQSLGEVERQIRAVMTANEVARTREQMLGSQAEELRKSILKQEDEVRTLTRLDVTDLAEKASTASSAATDAQKSVAAAREAHDEARQVLESARADERNREAQALMWSEQVAVRERELKTLHFNNELLKRVRAARPIITDKLWSLVLGTVSRYFSEMRGENSSVTKSSDGFKVDGHTVSTLSGSTLDILGLAVRVALVKTFLPASEFLVLDEPSAAMDPQRTINMLGFLASSGFKQTLLVTHEDISGDFADNIITL